MKTRISLRFSSAAILGLIFITALQNKLCAQNSLTDAGASPPMARPSLSQSFGAEALDFHTDPFTGRFTYELPIEFPPGPNGIKPHLSLTYDSSRKNGWCGVGWSLEMGYVERETRNGVPITGSSYSDSFGFVYEIEGKSGRLVGSPGSYGPEINTDGMHFAGPGGWQATDKSGNTYFFGQNGSSQISTTFGVFRWYLDEIKDRNNNIILITYSLYGGQPYIDHISYNGNYIAFATDSARPDQTSSAISGAKISSSRRLNTITVSDGTGSSRIYTLHYTSSPSTLRSLLTSIDESGGGIFLPTKKFAYQALSTSFGPGTSWSIDTTDQSAIPSANASIANSDVALVDINGDGLPDRVSRQASSPYNTFKVQLNTGSSFGGVQRWNNVASENNVGLSAWNSLTGNGGKIEFLDMNGDLLPDRVMQRQSPPYSSFTVQLNNGTSFNSITSWSGVVDDSGIPNYSPTESIPYYEYNGVDTEAMLIDMNGDGLPDRVMYEPAGGTHAGQLAVQLNTGSGFSGITYWTGVNLPAGVVVPVQTSPRGKDMNGQFSELIDVNGDGLPDRVYKSSTGAGTPGGMVQLNNGHNQFLTAENWNLPSGYPSPISVTDGDYASIFTDINGDGLPDLVTYGSASSFTVRLNTGSGFSATPINWNGVQNGGYTTGAGWDHPRAWDANGSRVEMMDMNGDGLPDRVIRGVGNNSLTVQLNAGPYPDLMTNIDSGVGSAAQISYKSSRQYPNSRIPFSANVVDQVTENDRWGNRVTTYTYDGGYYDPLYKEFRGFNHVVEQGPVMKTERYFYQGSTRANDTRYKAGMAYQINETGNDGFHRQTLNTISQVNSSLGGTLPYISSKSIDTLPCMDISYTYDASYGNILQEIDSPNDGTLPVTKTYAYSQPHDKPTSVTITGGDDAIQQTINTYDGFGNLLKKQELVCGSTYSTTQYTYDSFGNVATITDPMNIVTTIVSDPVIHAFPAQTTRGGFTEYATYNSQNGKVASSTSIAGLATFNSYDGLGRLKETWVSAVPNGTPNIMTAAYDYTVGSPSYITEHRNEPADPSGESTTAYTLDGTGEVYNQQVAGEGGQIRTITSVFDNLGRLTSESTGGLSTSYTYDSLGRQKTATVAPGDAGSPVGATLSSYGSCPLTKTVTDADSHNKEYTYDAFGRVTKIEEFMSPNAFTALTYDGVGNLTKITDNALNQTIFYYNQVGDKVGMADPDVGLWTYARDLAGRITSQTDSKGQVIKYFYNDQMGRVSSREGWNAANQRVSLVTYQYDSSGAESQYTVFPGQLFSVTDDEGWEKFSYDVRGRVISKTRFLTKNAQTYTTSFTYDDANRLLTTTYPGSSGLVTLNTYDTASHLIQERRIDGNGMAIVYYGAQSFDNFNRPQQLTFGNGATTTLGYYSNSKRLREFATTIPTGTIQDSILSYDSVGNILGLQDNVRFGTSSAGFANAQYDELNRLKSASWSAYGLKTYSYDSIGNLTMNGEFGTGSYNYGTARPHAVKSANGSTYNYDLDGNMIWRNGQQLSYDVHNCLSKVVNADGSVSTFGYDADGVRLWEQNGSAPLKVWIGNLYEENAGKVLYHVVAGDRRVCSFEAAAAGDTGYNATSQEFYYYHPDYLSSSSILTERSGQLAQHYEYSAFGQDRFTLNSSAFPVSHRFTGQVLDSETGLYYYGFRYYDPNVGRFIQPDDVIPDINNPQSYNKYSYVLDNPLRFTDPNGHAGKEIADWWSGQVAQAASFYQASDANWMWNGTVGTLNSLVGGLSDPLRLGSDAGRVSVEGGSVGTIARTTIQEISRVAAIVPVGAAIGKGVGIATTKVVGATVAKDATTDLVGSLGGCFLAGTVVATETGYSEIQDIKIGDLVWSFSLEKGIWELRHVIDTTVKQYAGDVLTILAGGELVKVTGNHPFWVVSGDHLESRPVAIDVPEKQRKSVIEGQWVSARYLKKGDLFEVMGGGSVSIIAIGSRIDHVPVFNFQVEENHTYTVGKQNVLVHNNSQINPVPGANAGGKPITTILSGVEVKNWGKVIGKGNVDLGPTIEGIESGKISPRNVFENREGFLPPKPKDYYKEYDQPTPGVAGAGPQRIIRGDGGEYYYTPDHYGSFVPLNN